MGISLNLKVDDSFKATFQKEVGFIFIELRYGDDVDSLFYIDEVIPFSLRKITEESEIFCSFSFLKSSLL